MECGARMPVTRYRVRSAVIRSLLVVAVIAVVACNACNARIAYNARNAAGPGSVQRAMTSWLVVVSRHLAPVIRGSLHES